MFQEVPKRLQFENMHPGTHQRSKKKNRTKRREVREASKLNVDLEFCMAAQTNRVTNLCAAEKSKSMCGNDRLELGLWV